MFMTITPFCMVLSFIFLNERIDFLNTFYLLLGIFFIGLCIIDFIWTTLWVDGGAGPVTNRLSSLLWKTMKLLGGGRSTLLSLAGPLVLCATLIMWIGMLWIGWTFVFTGLEQAISPSQGSDPISWMDRIYFAGYLIFTLGNGDFSPAEGTAQFVSVLATGTGMLFITFGVTYLLSILSAVTMKRSFAASVLGFGKSAEELTKSAWNGTDFHDFDLLLASFSEQLSSLAAKHTAYPVLHFYHSIRDETAMPTAAAILDESLSIIKYAVASPYHPNQMLVQEMRSSIDLYVKTLEQSIYKPAKSIPPLPVFTFLQQAGIPLLTEQSFIKNFNNLETRRRKLLGGLEADGRPWPIFQSSSIKK